MKNLILKGLVSVLAFVFTITIQSSAQTEPRTFTAKKAVYLEVGGGSGFYAINYSKIFHQKGMLKLSTSVGFSIWPNTNIDSKTSWLPALPLEISALYGKSNHHLELGMGFTSYLNTSFDFDSETFETIKKVVFDAFIPLRVGYRYQKPEGGFFFRVGYTPFFNVPVGGREDWNFDPRFAGISFGKSF
jgi:hypothetical protein